MHSFLAAVIFSMAAQATTQDALTADGLRAWLNAGGALEANTRLVHSDMQRQRVDLPPWWPDDVYAQEEDALKKLDFVGAALPFYQVCLTDPQARLLAKMTLSAAGQRVTNTATQAHSEAAEKGASATSAQMAGENAAAKAATSTSTGDKEKLAASLTPGERALAAQSFTTAKAAIIHRCMDQAFAKTADVMKTRQEEAIRAVIDANRPRLQAAKAEWEKEHPVKAQ